MTHHVSLTTMNEIPNATTLEERIATLNRLFCIDAYIREGKAVHNYAESRIEFADTRTHNDFVAEMSPKWIS